MVFIRKGFLLILLVLLVECYATEVSEKFDTLLEPNNWTEFQTGNVDYILIKCPDEMGRLRISKDSHVYDGKSKKAGIISRFFIDGDFSFHVDFDIESMPYTGSESSFNEVCIALVSVVSGETIFWVRSADDDKNSLLGYSNALGVSFGAIEDNTESGRAGISRIGNTVFLHIDRGGGDVIFTSLENPVFAGPMHVQMHIKQAGDPAPTTELDMRYDNCIIEADITKCPPRIILPKKNDNLVANKDYMIVWENPIIVTEGNYRLEYTADGGKTYNLISVVDVQEGQYLWRTPALSRNHCKIRLVCVNDENVMVETGEFINFICHQSIEGDLNADCYVDENDLAILASNWLIYGDSLNADCCVNLNNFAVLALNWLACGNRFISECQY